MEKGSCAVAATQVTEPTNDSREPSLKWIAPRQVSHSMHSMQPCIDATICR